MNVFISIAWKGFRRRCRWNVEFFKISTEAAADKPMYETRCKLVSLHFEITPERLTSPRAPRQTLQRVWKSSRDNPESPIFSIFGGISACERIEIMPATVYMPRTQTWWSPCQACGAAIGRGACSIYTRSRIIANIGDRGGMNCFRNKLSIVYSRIVVYFEFVKTLGTIPNQPNFSPKIFQPIFPKLGNKKSFRPTGPYST